jgi:DNA-binding NtrC family response regulator
MAAALIVHANPELRKLLHMLVEEHDLTTHSVSLGHQAIPLLTQLPDRLLILLDLNAHPEVVLIAMLQDPVLARRHTLIVMDEISGAVDPVVSRALEALNPLHLPFPLNYRRLDQAISRFRAGDHAASQHSQNTLSHIYG